MIYKIIENKIIELKKHKKKLKERILKFICYKIKNKIINFPKINIPNIFSEKKKFSPLRGKIKKDKNNKNKFLYCNSILTDLKFFGGTIKEKFKKNTSLRKDFIIEKYQVYESVCSKFNYVLLIYFLLDELKLNNFIKLFNFYKTNIVLEIKNKKELIEIKKKKINKISLIGINNRNLKNFYIDYSLINYSLKKVSKKTLLLSESGIKNINYVLKYFNRNVNCFLVGEYINNINFFFNG
ncbi:hypothetical protein [Candidatus Vidania fulgoroideorum]